MQFNYSALDSYEFELLSRDLAQRLTGIKLSCYTEGKDGGIDASDYYFGPNAHPSIVVQAKRWIQRASYSKLESTMVALINQLNSCDKLPSESLIFAVASGISEAFQQRLSTKAKSLGVPDFQLLDSVKFDQLLSDESNSDILRNHFKLWIAGTNVLQNLYNRSFFVGCDLYLADIDKRKSLFVQTELFNRAVDILKSNPCLLITGDPGTGKTTLTQMLALQMSADGYRVLYSSYYELESVVSASSPDSDLPELIVLDDFLGQNFLDVRPGLLRQISRLLFIVKKSDKRKIILNSRISILNEADRKDDSFHRLIRQLDDQLVYIDTSSMGLLDKARIFLSNLRFENVPQSYIKVLSEKVDKDKAGCVKICEHPNYNPRVIEYCSRPEFIERCDLNNYYSAIVSRLNNPVDIWKNEFEERLGEEERVLAYQLFSFGKESVSLLHLKTAFNSRIKLSSGIDCSIDCFDRAIKRLESAVVKTVIIAGELHVAMVNPSVNDYCATFLAANTLESASIVETAIYADQLETIFKVNAGRSVIDAFKLRANNGEVLSLEVVRPSSWLKLCTEHYVCFALQQMIELLTDKDFEWVGSLLKEMLDSPNAKAWESASLFLLGSGRGAFFNSTYYANLFCSYLSLSHLAKGTSVLLAHNLLESLEKAKKILNISNKASDHLLLALKAEADRWLTEYVIDSAESFGNGRDWEAEYQPSMYDCYIEDWETFVKEKIYTELVKDVNAHSVLCGLSDELGEFLTEDISLDRVEEAIEDYAAEYVRDLRLEYEDDRGDRDDGPVDDCRYEIAQYQNDTRAVERLFIESC